MVGSSFLTLKLTRSDFLALVYGIPQLPSDTSWRSLPKRFKRLLKQIEEEEKVKRVHLKATQFVKAVPIGKVLRGSVLHLMDIETVSGKTYSIYLVHNTFRDGAFHLLVAKVEISQSW